MGALQHPIWVHVATSQEVVRLGLNTMLERADAPFKILISGPPEAEPDVVLFDVILMRSGDTTDLDHWIAETATTVIAVDRTLRPELGAQARTRGVEWTIDLAITEADLVQVILQAAGGTLEDGAVTHESETGEFIGQSLGLSPRESTVLSLVVQGYSNQDIAEQLYLSINSVKTYIRSAYRKIDVNSRSRAVAWGIEQGFTPNRDDAVREDQDRHG